MNALIVLAHPEPQSFNAALARSAETDLHAQGHSVKISDLYASDFDPSEDARHFPQRKDPHRFYAQTEQRFSGEQGMLPAEIEREIRRIMWADTVILQFPLWWFGMPAILKGWMDRVFAYGTLYTGSRRFHHGVCQGKRAVLSVTAGSSAEACSHDGREGDTRLILWPINYALHYVGFTVLEPLILTSIRDARDDIEAHDQARFLEGQMRCHSETLASLHRRSAVPFNAEDDWDERRKLKAGAPVHSPFIRHNPQLPVS